MEYANLGRTGLSVSRLCLGTMNFGPETDEPTSHAIMDRALDVGLNFFDTANRYGAPQHGRTEEIMGRWFAKGGGRREKVVLATKLYGEMSGFGDIPLWPNNKWLSALNIKRACDASLKRMQTDYIDLYQMHHIDRTTPWEEIWQAMELLVQQGKIIYVGSSNFAGWHLVQAQQAAEKKNFMGLVSEQSFYNLVVRDIERELIPAAEHLGIGILPWSPLHAGMLGGVIKKVKEGKRRLEARSAETLEKLRPQVEKWENLCESWNLLPGDVALAWLLHQPAVTAPIIGPRTMEQFDASLRALEIKLSDEQLKAINEIFPGCKTHPEHYAW